MRALAGAPILLSVVASALCAQQPAYSPSQKLPNGKEIVAVYIGANSCGPCHKPEVKDAVMQMKNLVAAQAHTAGAAFSAVGVANDWDQAVAATFIASVGPFDQISLGGNWTNVAIEQYVWRDPQGNPAMPQVLVFERTVVPGGRITFSEPKVLRRIIGGDQIPEWVATGAPISPLPSDATVKTPQPR